MTTENRYVRQVDGVMPTKEDVMRRMYQDAYNVTNGGASNPSAMLGILVDMKQMLVVHPEPYWTNPAFRLVLDQLNNIVFHETVAPLADYQAVDDYLAAHSVPQAA